MDIVKKENSKYNKKLEPKQTKKQSTKDEVPAWFDQTIEKEELPEDELAELQKQLNEFR